VFRPSTLGVVVVADWADWSAYRHRRWYGKRTISQRHPAEESIANSASLPDDAPPIVQPMIRHLGDWLQRYQARTRNHKAWRNRILGWSPFAFVAVPSNTKDANGVTTAPVSLPSARRHKSLNRFFAVGDMKSPG